MSSILKIPMFINSKTEIASCQQKGKKQGNFTYKIMFWTCKYTKSVCHKHYMFGCECQKKVFAICSYFFYTVANAGGGPGLYRCKTSIKQHKSHPNIFQL